MITQHISFDAWNTLISPNPQFAAQRKELIAEMCGVLPEIVAAQYTATKKFVDTLAETDGIGLSTEQVYLHLIEKLHYPHNPSGPRVSFDYRSERHIIDLCRTVRYQVENLFYRHPPFFCPTVKEALFLLKDAGYTLSVSSNSNFISGKTVMRDFLHGQTETKFGTTFKYMLFSDELGFAKPSLHFFHKVFKTAYVDKPSRILHIGDNYKCDGVGPESVGMRYAIVKNPQEVLSVAKQIIEERK